MRSQHVAFTERNAVLNKIHEALVDVTGHSDHSEILEKVAFSSPPSEEPQGSSTLGVIGGCYIIALAAIDQLYSGSMLLLPSSWSIFAKS